MEIKEQLAGVYEQVYSELKTYAKVNAQFGFGGIGQKKFMTQKTITITPELIRGLKKYGYTIAVVPYKQEQTKVEYMSISEVTKAAAEAGMTYGKYVQTFGR